MLDQATTKLPPTSPQSTDVRILPYTTDANARGANPVRLSSLDYTAGILMAIMMIGPLFAAFYGRLHGG
jgi:predicted lipid-binding transport protein (Tim44 family)